MGTFLLPDSRFGVSLPHPAREAGAANTRLSFPKVSPGFDESFPRGSSLETGSIGHGWPGKSRTKPETKQAICQKIITSTSSRTEINGLGDVKAPSVSREPLPPSATRSTGLARFPVAKEGSCSSTVPTGKSATVTATGTILEAPKADPYDQDHDQLRQPEVRKGT